MTTKLHDLEEKTFVEDDSPELPPPDIVAYNELRSCADLFRMYTQRILEVQPEFQREIVWTGPAQTRFIDSLVKQLPIPSMCFSLDYKTQRWQVIDGLQRMATIIRFLSGDPWTLSKLDDIDPKLSGQPTSRLADSNSDLHSYYTRVENLTLPITVLRCDYSKRSHANYLFTIFHRLNTGGMKLNNQEIRNCIYGGSLNNLLKELNKNPAWMRINKMKTDRGHRFTKQELILRFFAFHDRYERYGGRLARFLNDYMDENRNPDSQFLEQKTDLFNRTVDVLYKKIFEGKAPTKLSVSVLEAVLVGVSFNLPFLESQPNARVKSMYAKLLGEDEFSEQRLSEGLAGKPRVIARMSTAKTIFARQ
ncbi:MAG: DUF262 domain-containing protein [Dehalococcoidia bacterium]|nr:DUF262 domain-containing protein [Dehalococcoidia bacterium]